MKTNAIIRIVLFSLAALILLGILLTAIFADFLSFDGSFFGMKFDQRLDGGTVSSSGSMDPKDISQINISWVSGTIRIQPGDVEQIQFQESVFSENAPSMVWKRSGSELFIQYSESHVSISGFGITINNNYSKDLTITVPRNWNCRELSLAVASANVIVENMMVDEVDFDGASGYCQFRECVVGDISLDTASGNIEFSGSLDTLDCDAASADCTIIVDNVPGRIDLDTMSGDLDLTLPEYCGFTVSLDTLSGGFTSDFETKKQNGSYVYGNGDCRITIDGMSGDVNIRKADSETIPTIPYPEA